MAKFMQGSFQGIDHVFRSFNGRRAGRQKGKERISRTSNLEYAPSYATDVNREKAMRKTRSILMPADVDSGANILLAYGLQKFIIASSDLAGVFDRRRCPGSGFGVEYVTARPVIRGIRSR